MPLYQNQLRNGLLALNPGHTESVDRLIKITDSLISPCKKYFPDDYLLMMKEMIKQTSNFEDFFRLVIAFSGSKKNPVDIFLPAALYDICTDSKNDFIGQTQKRLIQLIEHEKVHPGENEFCFKIHGYDEGIIDCMARSTGSRISHSLNIGNNLIAFLASYIELEEAAVSVASLKATAAEEREDIEGAPKVTFAGVP